MEILVVDDSATFRNIVQVILENAGYKNVVLLESPHAVLEYLQTASKENRVNDIGLVLMDVEMPGLSGMETVKRIKSNEALEDLPIIMVTGSESEDTIEDAFSAGAIDFINKPVKQIELLARVRSVLTLKTEQDRRKQKEKELIEANERLHSLSITDALSGLYNRRHFSELLEKEWRSCIRYKRSLAVVMLDVDYFKAFNDNYGHLPGDEAISAVAEVIRGALRRPEDIPARFGGEEYILMLPETDQDGAMDVATRVQRDLYTRNIPHAYSQVADILTVSIGIATASPKKGENSELILKLADDALYQAKSGGRNCIRIYREAP